MKSYKHLIEKYPLLFKHEEESMEPFALFGFECGEGWYHILEAACSLFYKELNRLKWQLDYVERNLKDLDGCTKRKQTVHPEFTKEEMLEQLTKDQEEILQKLEIAKQNLPRVAQIKEKFGTLRFYIDNSNDVTNNIVDYAEAMSEVTCEMCGNIGKTYTIGWHKTLCEHHAIEKYGKQAVEEFNLM